MSPSVVLWPLSCHRRNRDEQRPQITLLFDFEDMPRTAITCCTLMNEFVPLPIQGYEKRALFFTHKAKCMSEIYLVAEVHFKLIVKINRTSENLLKAFIKQTFE